MTRKTEQRNGLLEATIKALQENTQAMSVLAQQLQMSNALQHDQLLLHPEVKQMIKQRAEQQAKEEEAKKENKVVPVANRKNI